MAHVVGLMAPGEIQLWHARVSSMAGDQALWDEYGRWLSTEELAREQRFHQARDRQRHRLSRALERWVLSWHFGGAPHDWIFQADEHGRPFVIHPDPAVQSLQFNLSHTHEHIVLAVRNGGAVGVDVEGGRSVTASLDLAKQVLAEPELNAFKALPPPRQPMQFLAWWTLKEAYAKARGLGLALPLDQFGFDLGEPKADQPGPLQWWASSSIEPDPPSWRFWQYRLSEEVVVSLCAQAHQAQAVTWTAVLPGRTAQAQSVALWRATP
jgi:4'-phosphopantetheinyl transferase